MLTFTASFLSQFKRQHPELRYGQEFHQWARLDKITGEDLLFCDKLYQADEHLAKYMIGSRTDFSQ